MGQDPHGLVHWLQTASCCERGRRTLTLWLTPGHGDDRQPGPRLVQVTGSIRREYLEQVIVRSERHLQGLLAISVASDHRWRTPLARAMDGPESRPALLLIRGACARHDDLPAPLSGTSFADASGSAGDCQTFLRPRASGPHAFLPLRWGGAGEVESQGKGTGAPHCPCVPMLGGLMS
jgi:hypothetical protein